MAGTGQHPGPTFNSTDLRAQGGPLERRAVLFPVGTTFPSTQDFFARCRAASDRDYGVPTHPGFDVRGEISAWCTWRAEGCQYRIVALAQRKRWVLTERLCTWTHNHPAVKPGANINPYDERPRGATDGPDSPPVVPRPALGPHKISSVQAVRPQPPRVESARRLLTLGEQAPPPLPLPNSTATFVNLKSAYYAFSRALVPAFASSLGVQATESACRVTCGEPSGANLVGASACSFFIDLAIDPQSRRWGIGPSSVWQHSHGPAGTAGAEEGLSPTLSMTQDASPPSKRPRLAIDTSTRPTPSTFDSSRPTAAPTPAPSQWAASTVPEEHVGAPPSANGQSASSPSGSPAPPPPPLPLPASPCPPLPTDDPRTAVSALLAALDPSFVSLAPALVAAGLRTVEALATLALLDPAVLDVALGEVGLRAALGRSVRVDAERYAPLAEYKRLAVALRAAFAAEEEGLCA
ncbi:hypothetical protein JCM8208_007209 [Rhodotorula glutinis]